MDSDFLHDMKVRKIMRANGASAIAILICLFGNIYRDEGYFMRWDEDARFLIADDVGVKESYVDEVVVKAVKVGLFDSELFSGHQVLTSHGIQQRYKKAAVQKSDSSISPAYNLLELVSNDDNGVTTNGNQSYQDVSSADNAQSKEKKSKSNKSKPDQTETTTPASSYSLPSDDDKAKRNAFLEPLVEYYTKNIGRVTPSIKINLEKSATETSRFLVGKALIATFEAGKSDWAYTRGVLNNWIKDGIRTKEDYERTFGMEAGL
ncbi:Lin1244/Lin1753 domain-containing protein [Lacticaseibacillus saniviri]|uniref:DnaD domain protein n=3 Tax=Lacticaseibacillus saniviri TaxID=931533 RepID=A0A0R2MVY9_9LACO|nr:Lin1244/Lin1753 domain-containing protein [Lacticaseibacillus saniviri]KRO15779.1 DnaD domain protein [Lacticaseibacillus saniviri JCM 17471 = DSM 24301]